jgi:uncharacterized membrane protein YadS
MGQPITASFFQRRAAQASRDAGALVPGVALASVLALLALELANLTILPAVLVGLLLGMAVAGFAERPLLEQGLSFSSMILLRLGVAVLGGGVTLW